MQSGFLSLVQDFEKVLKQRNALLRQAAEGVRVDDMLAVYDTQLATLGVALARARAEFVSAIADDFGRAFTAITHTAFQASARYETQTTTADEFVAALQASRARDLGSGSTQFGPHRDDLVFELDAREAGSFASQGQLRAMLLAWKTAELALLARTHGDAPILLLDDVSSELDPSRNAYLFEHLAEQASQCFITTTHEGHVLLSRDRANYRIQNGQISS
jgi:DNA replication and repair protein RecF